MGKDWLMAMSSIARSVQRRVGKTPLGDLAFRVACRAAGGELPNDVEARKTLEAISPRPEPAFRSFAFKNNATCDLTVIIPCYNVEDYVEECLKSVLAQSFPGSIEVIAINDGSTDGTLDAIKACTAGCSNVRIIDQENRGFSGARNIGIDEARGRALAFVDSDDALERGHLAALWDALERSGADFVSGLYNVMNDAGQVLGLGEERRTHGAPWSRLYKREVWQDIRFPEGFWFEDTVLAYCVKTRFKEAISENAGYLYRTRGSSVSAMAAREVKSLDAYWVVEEMLEWCRSLGVAFDQGLYDQTVKQMGPLLMGRTAFLDDAGRRALFALCCDLMSRTLEFSGMETGLGCRWLDVDRALRECDYSRWLAACRWM